jgi:hypothetical protein
MSRSLALLVCLLALLVAPSAFAWHSQCAAKRGRCVHERAALDQNSRGAWRARAALRRARAPPVAKPTTARGPRDSRPLTPPPSPRPLPPPRFTYEGGLLSTGKPRKGASEKAPSCCAKCRAADGCAKWTYDGTVCSYFDASAVKAASATVQWYGVV